MFTFILVSDKLTLHIEIHYFQNKILTYTWKGHNIMKKTLSLCLIILIFFITGCTNDSIDQPANDATSGNPTPEERLSENPDADIIMIDNITHINAEEINRRINEGDLALGEKVLEVKVQSTNASDFKTGTASKLPVGTEIFRAKNRNSAYIAVVNGKMRLYVSYGEG